MRSLFLKVWLLCGTLDALYATVLDLLRGKADPGALWRGVASGPFGDGANHWGPGGALAGVAVHFAIMAVMVAIGLWLARKSPLGEVATWKGGTFFGLMAYCVMYGLVLPMRFGVPFPNPDKVKLLLALFPHVFLVGLPIFHLARRTPQLS
jgi:hypothetical protein